MDFSCVSVKAAGLQGVEGLEPVASKVPSSQCGDFQKKLGALFRHPYNQDHNNILGSTLGSPILMSSAMQESRIHC